MATGFVCIRFDTPISFRDADMTDVAYASRVYTQTRPLVAGVGTLSGVKKGVVVRGDRSLCVSYDTATIDPDEIIAGVQELLPVLMKEFAFLFFDRTKDNVTMQRMTCRVHGSVTV